MPTRPAPPWLVPLLRHARTVAALAAAALSALANAAPAARFVREAVGWLAHLRLP